MSISWLYRALDGFGALDAPAHAFEVGLYAAPAFGFDTHTLKLGCSAPAFIEHVASVCFAHWKPPWKYMRVDGVSTISVYT